MPTLEGFIGVFFEDEEEKPKKKKRKFHRETPSFSSRKKKHPYPTYNPHATPDMKDAEKHNRAVTRWKVRNEPGYGEKLREFCGDGRCGSCQVCLGYKNYRDLK